MAFSDDIATRHDEICAIFTEYVEHVPDWDAPSPVPEWQARDVVAHLVEWLPGFIQSGAGIQLDPNPVADPASDPVRAWAVHRAAVQALLEDPEKANTNYVSDFMGTMPLGQVIDQFYTSDVFMHTWDLAKAAGLDITLDPDLAGQLLAGMKPMEEMIRSSKQFGEQRPVAEDADTTAQLIAFIGRDPNWQP